LSQFETLFLFEKNTMNDLSIMTRDQIYQTCCTNLQQREAELVTAITELSAGTEGKSTAGDKHETAQAMAQMEQEKLANQLAMVRTQLAQLQRNEATATGNRIVPGHLIATNKGWIYLSTALGKVNAGSESVMVISPQSPLGMKLQGQEAGSRVLVNGTEFEVQEVL
jgi:hypothetical protein